MTEMCLGSWLCVQWSRIPQAWTDDCGLWEPVEKDDGGVCPSWKSKICMLHLDQKSYYSVSHLIRRTWFNLSSLPFVFLFSFSLCYGSRCQMHWSPCRWSTHAGICLQISGGTLSCSVWLVLLVPCSTRLNLTRSGFAIVFNYFCELSSYTVTF